ncbi:hypothetical protein K32_48600 [Kaistia sp. 32K]|uniref:hypothetical protein n=1 Tax=Kaistia sp. 32K TaxID=2795690 RepID=UPI0019164BE5|nr:hypothetical protein [Kaistia sp. 32K]BCP56243.1 hypothetical protein K32_48600 [Kaistia sp. 32K]
MTAWQFMSDSPWLTFFLACVASSCVVSIARLPFRAMNIRKHGWPPAHLDADGDYKAHKLAEAPAKAERDA